MSNNNYFVPHSTRWPMVGCLALFFMAIGLVNILHGEHWGPYILLAGIILLTIMLFGWFGTVIDEGLQGLHSPLMDKSYRWGMVWFIVSEIAFFGIFFMALFYIRMFVVPELGGHWGYPETHTVLWPEFKSAWPLLVTPNPAAFPSIKEVIPVFGIPALNTFLLLSSAVAVTWSHWGLLKNRRSQMLMGLILTIVLGLIFLSCQAFEYGEAYRQYNLTLKSGVYGTTFFMLTGFHALHVTVGLMMLSVVLVRCIKGHFLPEHHFAFEAVSWYWHFVDVVWLFLFVLVYWL